MKIGDCEVRIEGPYVVTQFADGKELVAAPNYTEEDIARATALGYTSVEDMNCDHDVVHTLLAEARGQSESPTLRGVVEGKSYENAADEEAIVMLIQRVSQVGLRGVLNDR